MKAGRALRGRRAWPALALSLLLHGVLLLALVRVAPRVAASFAPPVEVTLIPSAAMPFEAEMSGAPAPPSKLTSVARSPPQAAPAPTRPAQRQPPASQPAISAAEPLRSAAPPAPSNAGQTTPSQAPAASKAGPTGSPTIPFFVGDLHDCRSEDLILLSPAQRTRCDGRIAAARSSVTTLADCWRVVTAHMVSEQREACDRLRRQQVAQGAYHAVDSIPADKRAYFDAVEQAYADVRNGQGRPPVFVCPFGIPKGYKVQTPSHAVKVGPCYLMPPKGFGTEEADVKRPF